MTVKIPKNIPASVRQRLLEHAKFQNRPFGELLYHYAMERFLYRLSISKHKTRFILKGALMLRVWDVRQFRTTLDIDLLGKTSNEERSIISQVKDIVTVNYPDDGICFDEESLRVEKIKKNSEYEGIRIIFRGELDSAIVKMQLDIGFGDIVYPQPMLSDMPVILDFPAPKLLCYSRESAIAEKFEAMVSLGELNSRMKDFYDIWLLSRQFEFDGEVLMESIKQTFNRRQTVLVSEIVAFSDDFVAAKQTQWNAFRRRIQQDFVPHSFNDIVTTVSTFLLPIISAITLEKSAPGKWIADGSWQ